MMRTLQLVLFQALFKFNIPANLQYVISIILPIVSFDLLENIIDWEDNKIQNIMQFDFETQYQKQQNIPDQI